MGRLTLTLPRLGETMEEAKVTTWLVAPGATFARGDVLLEVETDKTVVEVPALTAGTLITQLVAAGDTVALSQPIAEVEVEGATAPAVASIPAVPPATVPPADAPPQTAPATTVNSGTRPAASPAARAAARHAGVDLTTLQGSGRRGRIQALDMPGGQGGPTLVLLHGLFDHSKGWRDLPRRMQATGHAVLTLDLPGHADSAPATSVEAAVDELAAQMPDGRLRLIGHSLGAALAVRLALRLGARVAGLVLSAPAGLGSRINADFADGMLAAETPAALARALDLLGGGPLSSQALDAELARLTSQRPGHLALAHATARNGFQQIDITADLARLTCPVTVLFGTGDRILSWQDVAHVPPSTAIHLIRGAGHLPHHAAPDLFLSLTTDGALLDRRIAQP
ncbi:MAG: alpha/beta fold hydrolase [Candidatus Saccharibacteria bacterium]|nr:alpha/beta fold hydrolase [Pseudorhodobacter sp.]